MYRIINSMKSRQNKMNVRTGVVMAMILSFMFLPTFEVDATHIVGGQISYNVVGFERVELELIVRRDCDLGDPEADYDNPAYIGVFDLNGVPVTNPIYGFTNGRIEITLNPADTLEEGLVTGCEVLMNLVCVQEATYRITRNVKEHPSGGYIFAYQRCCRNASLTNILDPLNTGMTIVSVITNEALVTRNQSPILPDFPPIYACIDAPYEIPQGGVDPDGDELRYRLNTPNIGATNANPYPTNPTDPPYDPVTWESGYSLANLMSTSPALTIDPTTGTINVIPEAEGQFLVSFCVEEIRNDRVFNTTCREFEVNVRPCGEIAIANIDAPDLQCDDLEVDFESTGSNADSLTWIVEGDTIRDQTAITYTFSETGIYTVYLWAYNQGGCTDLDSHSIELFDSGVTPDFDMVMVECADSIVVLVTDASTYDPDNPLVDIYWDVSIGGSSVAADTGTSFELVLHDNATVTICQDILVDNGCVVTNCQTADFSLLEVDFEQDVTLCLEEESTITVTHIGMDDITVVWTPNDIITSMEANGTIITVLTAESLDTTLYFTATNEFGCSVSDSILISTGGKRPAVSFFVNQICGSLEIQLNNTTADTTDVIWDFGDNSPTSDEWEPNHTYDEAGTYTITLTGGTVPCDSTVSMTVTIPIADPEFADTLIQCFTDSIDLNPGGNPDWEYVWSPASIFSNVNAVNPRVLVSENTTVYVSIIVYEGENFCTYEDSIFILAVPDFTFNLNPADDVTVCEQGENSILLWVETMEGVAVSWKDNNGTVLSENDSFEVVLNEGVNQFTVMGIYNGIEECMKSESISVTLDEIELSLDIINVEDGSELFCEPDTGKLIVTVDGPEGNYTYEWAPQDGVISGSDNDSLCIFVNDGITYCVTVTNTDLGCSANACYTVEYSADVTVVLLDDDGVICIGDTVKLAAEIMPEGMDCTYSWDVTGTIIGPDDQDTICYIASTTHIAMVSVGCVGGCTSSASVQVEVRDLNALIQATADPTTVTEFDQIVQLDVLGGDPNWLYNWEGPEIIDPITIKNPRAMPGIGEHTYSVTVVDDFGCEGTSSITLPEPDENPCEEPYVYVPNAFSPNGDNQNETLNVYGYQITSIITFIIYNRWGQEVYRVDDVGSASWDGTLNGDELEADVYGYYLKALCENGEEGILQGNISLLR